MNANELMIGDWVHIDVIKGGGEDGQVTSIYTERDRTCISTESGGYFYDDYFSSIPITVDILKRNGFRELEHRPPEFSDYKLEGIDTKSSYWVGVRFIKNGITIIDCGCGGYNARPYITFGKYKPSVHELQHVMRLCGIEKEVVL